MGPHHFHRKLPSDVLPAFRVFSGKSAHEFLSQVRLNKTLRAVETCCACDPGCCDCVDDKDRHRLPTALNQRGTLKIRSESEIERMWEDTTQTIG
ncbi:hypothetical protein EVAR_93249_1 [Eumeta japonica]|uniref:Uncharacterized protein n=1 Tax=Eumeta variegata TaxID=151549 RepID=A0A4C1TXN4_EUMVA|nr:hypothetical protein EVAR_93249_1 [Eumeta japonica]